MEEDPQISEEEAEDREWIESLEYVIENSGRERASDLLKKLRIYSQKKGVRIPYTSNTPYVNTIALEDQPRYPGDYEIERNIRSIIRWNAMAMVVRANRIDDGIGGHISTYASAATLYEIGFHHFFRAADKRREGDMIYFQGHASPGIYARAFLEGTVSIEQMRNFRRELGGDGLSSYPHPWLMPGFWQFSHGFNGPLSHDGDLPGPASTDTLRTGDLSPKPTPRCGHLSGKGKRFNVNIIMKRFESNLRKIPSTISVSTFARNQCPNIIVICTRFSMSLPSFFLI